MKSYWLTTFILIILKNKFKHEIELNVAERSSMNGVKENERNEWMSGRQQQFKKLNLGSSGAAIFISFHNYGKQITSILQANEINLNFKLKLKFIEFGM